MFCMSASPLLAQDIHFTQNHSFPLHINPALTGWFSGDYQVSAIYREQWKAINGDPYGTIGISAERQHHIYTEQINYGISIVQDKTSASNYISRIFTLSGSYYKEYLKHQFQAGVQIGFVNNSLNSGDFTFDSQFDLGEDNMFNPDISSGEALQESKMYLDLNFGGLWSKQIARNITPLVGLSAYHVNYPNESIYNTRGANVPLRLVVHGKVKYDVNKKIRVLPHVIYMNQRKATELLMGGSGEIDIAPKTIQTVFAGAQFRYGMENNSDAIAFMAGARYQGMLIGVSYDYNISNLKIATNSRGAFEVSLRYIFRSTQVENVKVSCDRI